MKKIFIVNQPHSVPVYDDKTGKFLYWRMWYNINENVIQFRHFKNTLLSRGYKKMCRFQRHLVVKQNENTK